MIIAYSLTAVIMAAAQLIPSAAPAAQEPRRPNVVVILSDDQGYGDIQALGPGCAVPTPNMDRLCEEGAVFTAAYSASAYCTPSRYSLMTGRYTWRTYLKVGFPVHYGHKKGAEPAYPDPKRLTIPRMLADGGYRTAAVGKWHLSTAPEDLGFEYSFLHDGYFAKRTRFTENGVPVPYADQLHPPPSLKPGTTYAELRAAKGTLTNEDLAVVLPETTDRAVAFVEDHVENHSDEPFFLYFAPHTMHTPYNVPAEYDGIDFRKQHAILQSRVPIAARPESHHNYLNFLALHDHCVGKVLAALDEHGLAENTIVIYSSDNGSLGYAWSTQVSPEAAGFNAPRGSVADAKFNATPWSPNGDRSGYKTMSLDGGVRVPLMVRWPGHVSADVVDDTPRCLTDVISTLADLLRLPMPEDAAEDSISFADRLLSAGPSPRGPVVHHSRHGHLGLRQGRWKLIHANGHGGGGTFEGRGRGDAAPQWSVDPSALQLFDMEADPQESHNVAEDHPELVEQMVKTLARYYGKDGTGAPSRD